MRFRVHCVPKSVATSGCVNAWVDADMDVQDPGWIYLLTNDHLVGLIKIGYTRDWPAERARQLSGTGVPTDYSVSWAVLVENPVGVERRIHCLLEGSRVASNREFFRCSLDAAKHAVLIAAQDGAIFEMNSEGEVTPAAIQVKLGGTFSCPACTELVRPFNSVLTDRAAGVTGCPWCGQRIRFYVSMDNSPQGRVVGPHEIPSFHSSLTPKNVVPAVECPYCLSLTRVRSAAELFCESCKRSIARPR